MASRVNCRADFVFQAEVQVPRLTDGVLATPALGAVTDVKVRIAAAPTGLALHASLDALPASERTGKAGKFFVPVDAALLTAHVLPLGVGQSFYAIWSKAGDFDDEAVRYLVADGNLVA